MDRFDDEEELESTALGRSLLSLVREEDEGMDTLPRRIHAAAPPNPFEAIRARLASTGHAIRGLGPQVHANLCLCAPCAIHKINKMALQCAFIFFRTHRTSFPPMCCLGLAFSVVSLTVLLLSTSTLGLHSVHGCFSPAVLVVCCSDRVQHFLLQHACSFLSFVLCCFWFSQ